VTGPRLDSINLKPLSNLHSNIRNIDSLEMAKLDKAKILGIYYLVTTLVNLDNAKLGLASDQLNLNLNQ